MMAERAFDPRGFEMSLGRRSGQTIGDVLPCGQVESNAFRVIQMILLRHGFRYVLHYLETSLLSHYRQFPEDTRSESLKQLKTPTESCHGLEHRMRARRGFRKDSVPFLHFIDEKTETLSYALCIASSR